MTSRKRQFAFAAVVVVLAAVGIASAATLTVGLGATGPQPADITVDWGDTVAFVNNDTVAHGIASSRSDLSSGLVAPGGTTTAVVTARAGSYQYRQTGSKNLSGTVEVTASGRVTLVIRVADLLYGQRLSLNGVATKGSTPVIVEERAIGDAQWTPTATLTSGEDGTYAATLSLARSAKLRATIDGGQIRSGQVTVRVAPRLSFRAAAHRTHVGHTVVLRAALTPPGAARRVTFLECAASVGRWQTAGTARTTSVGVASLRWRALPGKTLLRASIGRKDAEQGFAPGESAQVAVTGAGAVAAPKHDRPHGSCS
jgi:plastocyanin